MPPVAPSMGIGDFGVLAVNTPTRIPAKTRLDLWNASKLPVALTLFAANGSDGGSGVSAVIQAGQVCSFHGRIFSKLTGATGADNVLYAVSHPDDNPAFGTGSSSVQGFQTSVQESETSGPAAQAQQTETVLVAGTTTIIKGSRIRFMLSMAEGSLANAASLTYIALKGHASGVYYALVFIGESVSGAITMDLATGEKIDIVLANANATACQAYAHWCADSPGLGL